MEKQLKIYSEPPPIYGQKVLCRQIDSELGLKNPLIEELMEILRSRQIVDENDEVWARLCLDEVIINAIKHGNKENRQKKVNVSLFIDKKTWAIRVEDEGKGFRAEDIPTVESDDYWESEHGRGIMLMQSYMDEIWYYDNGKRVQLKKIKKNCLQKLREKVLAFLGIRP